MKSKCEWYSNKHNTEALYSLACIQNFLSLKILQENIFMTIETKNYILPQFKRRVFLFQTVFKNGGKEFFFISIYKYKNSSWEILVNTIWLSLRDQSKCPEETKIYHRFLEISIHFLIGKYFLFRLKSHMRTKNIRNSLLQLFLPDQVEIAIEEWNQGNFSVIERNISSFSFLFIMIFNQIKQRI